MVPDLIHAVEFRHVGEKHRDVDDVAPRETVGGEHALEILEDSGGLRLDVVRNHFARGVPRHSGIGVGVRMPATLARNEEEIADASGMRILSHGARESRQINSLGSTGSYH